MLLLLLLFALSLVIYLFSLCYSGERRRLINKIPGPPTIPLFGNALEFNTSPEMIWKKFFDYMDEYYPIGKVWMGPIPVVVIRHPDDFQAILSCKVNINKTRFIYGAVSNYGMDGVLMSKGNKWKHRRRLLNPVFSSGLIRRYVDVTSDYMTRFIKNIAPNGEEAIVEVYLSFLMLSMEILSDAAFGVDIKKVFTTKEEEEFMHAFDEFSEILFERVSRPYILDWMTHFMDIGAKVKRVMPIFYKFKDKILEEKKKQNANLEYESFLNLHEQMESEVEASIGKGHLKGLAILDLLIAAHHNGLIDDQGLSEEFFILLSAGFETSGAQMGFILLLLAENKKAQDLARAEVEKVFHEAQGNVGYAEIIKLEYIERCVKESLRLYPTAPLIGRTISEDIHFHGYKVPAGTQVLLAIYALHRDANFWPEPNKFDPDRFLPGYSVDRHPFAYLPFSAGPRNCIGQKFALVEVQTVVAHILYNFEIEPITSSADIEFVINFTLKPKVSPRVKFRKIIRG